MCGKGHNSLRRVHSCCTRDKKKTEEQQQQRAITVIQKQVDNQPIELVELVTGRPTTTTTPLTNDTMPKIIAIAQQPK